MYVIYSFKTLVGLDPNASVIRGSGPSSGSSFKGSGGGGGGSGGGGPSYG